MPTTEQIAADIYARIITERWLSRAEERGFKPKELAKIAIFSLEAASAFVQASQEIQSAAGPA